MVSRALAAAGVFVLLVGAVAVAWLAGDSSAQIAEVSVDAASASSTLSPFTVITDTQTAWLSQISHADERT
jgi:hypothetical protein